MEKDAEERMYGKSQIAVCDVENFPRGRSMAPHCVTCCCQTSARSVKCSIPAYLRRRELSSYAGRCDLSKSRSRRGNSASAERNVTTIDELLREINLNASLEDGGDAREKEDTLISETQEDDVAAHEEDSTIEKRPNAFGSYYWSIRRGQSKVSAAAESSRTRHRSCETCLDNRQYCHTIVDEEQRTGDEQTVSVTRTEDIGGCSDNSDKAANEHQQLHSTYLQYSNCRTSPFRLTGAGDRNRNVLGRRGSKKPFATAHETNVQTSKVDFELPAGLDHEEHVRQLKLARYEFIQRISEEARKLQRLQRYLDGYSPPRRRNRYRRNVSRMMSASKMSGDVAGNKLSEEF